MWPWLRSLTLLALGLPLLALARPTITWAIVEGPPEHERPEAQRIEDLGQGPLDQALRLLAGAAPGVEHRVEAMSLEKVWRDMRLGRPVCFADAFMTAERLQVAHFVELGPSPRMLLVALPDRLPPGEEVSLRALLAQDQLRGLFGRQRSYGEPLDRLLAEFQVRREPLPPDSQLRAMLEQGRMDYILENANGWLQTSGEGLDTRLVREGRQTPAVHVACGQAVSRAVVRQLDTAVRGLAQQAAWLELKLLGYPQSVRAALRPRIQQQLQQRAAGGPRIRWAAPASAGRASQ